MIIEILKTTGLGFILAVVFFCMAFGAIFVSEFADNISHRLKKWEMIIVWLCSFLSFVGLAFGIGSAAVHGARLFGL